MWSMLQVPGSVVLDAQASNSDRRRVILITRGEIELIGLNITGGFCRDGAGLYIAPEIYTTAADKPVVTMTELMIYGNTCVHARAMERCPRVGRQQRC